MADLDRLIRDTAAFNRSMNDPEDWKKRRKMKLEEYELPKIAAEGAQQIERQKIANIPEVAKQKWESSDRYFEKQEDLISAKNRPEMMTARTNAGYKDYLTSQTKHARDIENTMAEQVYQIRGQDQSVAAAFARANEEASARKRLGETPEYGGTASTTGVAVPPGAPTSNRMEDVPLSNPEDPYSWSSDPQTRQVATIPEKSTIDSLSGIGPRQSPQVSATPRAAAYYDKYLGTQQPTQEQNVFEKYGTAPAPDSYLAEWGLKNKRYQKRRNRDLYED